VASGTGIAGIGIGTVCKRFFWKLRNLMELFDLSFVQFLVGFDFAIIMFIAVIIKQKEEVAPTPQPPTS
jgi:hypothetical protein